MTPDERKARARECSRRHYHRNKETIRLKEREKRLAMSEADADAKRAYDAAYYQRNRQAILDRVSAAYTPTPRRLQTEEEKAASAARRRDYAREKHYANHEQRLAQKREWSAKNREKGAAYRAKRRALQLLATPAWRNDFFISEAYAISRQRSEITGIRWEVDHIVPLDNPIVCGLHVESNLRVVPMKLNRSKSNRHWPDMPT